MSNDNNRRILLIDDTPSIHEDFKKILNKSGSAPKELDDAMSAFLGNGDAGPSAPSAENITFEIDSAFQGAEALEKVKIAKQENRPYAMAFVDIRMPPGWDGVRTIEEMWKVDTELQAAICTAYSDYSWDQTIARLGSSDRLLILKKPFDAVEVCQFANALTEKWNISRREHGILERLKLAEQESRAYASSLETVNRTLITAKAASDKVTELKTTFLLRLSEEVNNSVKEILERAGQLRSLHESPPADASYLDKIINASERLLSTFNETLDITMIEARRGDFELSPAPARSIVHEVFASFRDAAAAKSLAFNLEIADDVPETVKTNPNRFRRIIFELIENAIQFTSQGKVAVSLRMEQTEHWERPNLRIDVTDTGCGIDQELRGKIFEPFVHNNRAHGGQKPGLGLALSRKLAEAIGGEINVETAPGKGSAFTLIIEGASPAPV
ncbi:MAG: hybrid sensor histidine kinase/response regulator [Planctomycetota bacterium]